MPTRETPLPLQNLWQLGDFTSPRLGSPRDQDGVVLSRSEKIPEGQMAQRSGEENGAPNVNMFFVPVGDL